MDDSKKKRKRRRNLFKFKFQNIEFQPVLFCAWRGRLFIANEQN